MPSPPNPNSENPFEETREQRDIRVALASRGMIGRSDVRRFIRTVDRICQEFGQLTPEEIGGLPFEDRHAIWLTYIDAYNRAQGHKRRAAARRSANHHTPDDIRDLFVMYEGRCAYCLQDLNELGYHVDHVQPLSRGGSNGPENILLACHDCNLNKGDKLLEEWTNRWYLTEVPVTELKFTGLLWKWMFFDGQSDSV